MPNLTAEQKAILLSQMNERFHRLKRLAESMGYSAYLFQSDVFDHHSNKPREWGHIVYQSSGLFEPRLTSSFNDLNNLEHILINDRVPKFKENDKASWEAWFQASGKYQRLVTGQIEKVSFDIRDGFRYYCRCKKPSSLYVTMLSSNELWLDENELSAPGSSYY